MTEERAEHDSETPQATCSDCGNTVKADEDGYAECWGYPGNMHGKRTLLRPCENCGKPQPLELCADCGEELEGDAVTPTWGKHRYD